LKAWSKEFGTTIAGWAHKHGQGKVVCLTPGHTREVLHKISNLIINSVEL